MTLSAAAKKAQTFAITGPTGLRHAVYLGRFIRNYTDGALALFHEYGDVVRTRYPDPYVTFFHPKHIKHVLKDNIANYPKSKRYDLLRPILGQGIFVAEGDLWARQRRLMAPEFRENTVGRFVPVMVECVESLFAEWDRAAGPVDVSEDMMRVTLWIVGGTLFKDDFRGSAEIIGHALGVCLEHATLQLLSMGLYASWLPLPGNFRARKAERDLNDTIREIIRRGRGGEVGEHDVLSRMMVAKDEAGKGMSDEQLLDETKSLILAGHETTSLTLSWAFYLLSQNREAAEKLAEEATRVLGDGLPTADKIAQLTYSRMVFMEAMRLYPPVPTVSRGVLAEDVVDGVRVGTDEMVAISPYVTHRHPAFWPAPERFDPERFAPDKIDQIEPFSYLPFLLGRRACLGEHFAMLEGPLLLSMIARRYQLTRVDDSPIPTRPISTLRLARPLVMNLRRRGTTA